MKEHERLTLVAERSVGISGVAVFRGRELVCVKRWEAEPSRTPEWIAEAGSTLEQAGIELSEIGQFICGLGPGSFSGIRSCLAALQGMALPGGLPVYGVSSAAALALGQACGEEAITVAGDARRDRIWCVTYRVDRDAAQVLLQDGSVPRHTGDDFTLTTAEEMLYVVPEETRVVSPEWRRLGKVLTDLFPTELLVRQDVFPDVVDLGRLALAEPGACLSEPVPIYLHPAVAAREG